MKSTLWKLTGLLLLSVVPRFSSAQTITVNLAPIDGVELTPANIFNYLLMNTGNAEDVRLRGTIKYRNSTLQFSYEASVHLEPGTTVLSKQKLSGLHWNFSENALKELFFNYSRLPQGVFEYCVELTENASGSEQIPTVPVNACLYHTEEDIFLINLVEPENDAKLYEPQPMFSWIVNFPFASELSYRIRVAELRKGQTPENAINRNPPVFQDNHLLATTTDYPVTAKPLEKWQYYVWTVDAYYKGLLLGGAETWKFMIIEDSLLQKVSRDQSYVELNLEQGYSLLYAAGIIKLKYIESEQRTNVLHLDITDEKGKPFALKDSVWHVSQGDNRKTLDISDELGLKHGKAYHLTATTDDGTTYHLSFVYINPIYLK